MNDSKKISAIIPVYNAEQYVGKCIDSILAQTHTDFEIILINDGSKDNSEQICTEYTEKYSNIKLINKENGGVSAARNTGVEHATGEYVSFIDADDTITPDYFETLFNCAQKNDADIVCCDFFEILNGQSVSMNTPKVLTPRLVDSEYELFFDLVDCKEAYGTSVWAKIIKTSLAKKVKFKPLSFGEDQIYMFDLFALNPKVYLVDYKGYYYIRNEDSVTVKSGDFSIKRNLDELEMHRYKFENLPTDAKALYPRFYDRYAASVSVLARTAAMQSSKAERSECRKKALEIIKDVKKHSNMISARTKIYLGLYQYMPWLYRWLLVLKDGK